MVGVAKKNLGEIVVRRHKAISGDGGSRRVEVATVVVVVVAVVVVVVVAVVWSWR